MNAWDCITNCFDSKSRLNKYLTMSLDERFELHRIDCQRIMNAAIQRKIRERENELYSRALKSHLTFTASQQTEFQESSFQQTLIKMAAMLDEVQKQKNDFLDSFTPQERVYFYSTFFKDGDLQENVLSPGDEWCLMFSFSFLTSKKDTFQESRYPQFSDLWVKAIRSNMCATETGFLQCKGRPIFSGFEFILDESQTFIHEVNAQGNGIMYNQNYVIPGESRFDKNFIARVAKLGLPIHHVSVNSGFSIEFQPRFKNRFATPEIIDNHGIGTIVMDVLVKLKMLPTFFLNLLPNAAHTTGNNTFIGLLFRGLSGDDVFFENISNCRFRIINNQLFAYYRELKTQYPDVWGGTGMAYFDRRFGDILV